MCKVVISKENFDKKELLEELCNRYDYTILNLEDNIIIYQGYFDTLKFNNIDDALIDFISDLENYDQDDDSEEFLDRIKKELDFIRSLKEEKENNKNNSKVKNMKKSDLKDMMILETMYGGRYLYLKPYALGFDERLFLDEYDENFKLIDKYCEELDIVKIYKPKTLVGFNDINDDKLELIWKREEKIYVDFMEIMRLFKEGKAKTIYCELGITTFKYEGSSMNPLKGLKEKNTKEGLSLEEILEGKWYYLK